MTRQKVFFVTRLKDDADYEVVEKRAVPKKSKVLKKQPLKVKTFVGTSENAVQTQIWTALTAMLLVKYLQLKSTFGWSLSNLAALLRQQLFVYRDLMSWLNDPFPSAPGIGRGARRSTGSGVCAVIKFGQHPGRTMIPTSQLRHMPLCNLDSPVPPPA